MKKLIFQYFLVGIIFFLWSGIYAFLCFMEINHWTILLLLVIASVTTAYFAITIRLKRKISPLVRNAIKQLKVLPVTLDSKDEERSQYAEFFISEIDKARDCIIIVSDNLNSGLYCNKNVLKTMESKIKEGVNLKILCGQNIVTPDGSHKFIEHFISDNQLKEHVTFYKRINRPPALHYKVIDKKRLVIEAIHSFGVPKRDILVVEDERIVQLFLNKFEFCIKSNTSVRVPNVAGFNFVRQFPSVYEANYKKALRRLKLNEAEENSLEWLMGCFRKECFSQIQRGEEFAFI